MSDIATGYFRTNPKPKNPSRFPRLPLFAALSLIAFAAGATVFGSMTGIGAVRDTFGEPQAIRDVVLTQTPGDVVEVHDLRTGDLIAAYAPGEGGFVRGAMRALHRMRLVAQADASEPYRIIRWQNGAISLSDTHSGERLYLNAFGPDNAAAFENLLSVKGSTRP